MKASSLGIVLFTTVLSYSTFYLPQPILPLLATEFSVTSTDAALLTAVTMAPLGFAPIFYGYLTGFVSTKRLLLVAVAILAISQAALGITESFWAMVVLRFVQGLVLPAIFTSLMTYSAKMARPGRARNAINIYISATIFGGFAGRLFGGVVSDVAGWRWAFLLTSGLLLVALVLVSALPDDTPRSADRIKLNAAREILSQPFYRDAYISIFLIFFVFASILNYIPFRLKSLEPDISGTAVSLLYLGYLSGSVIAFNGVRIANRLGGELRGISVGLVLLALGLCGTLIPGTLLTFLFVFLMAGSFFLIHSLLAAFLNHRPTASQGVVNGLYLSCYYSGGALGGWLPGYIYRASGWEVYVICLTGVLCFGMLWLWRMRSAAV